MHNTVLLVDDVRLFLEIQKEFLQNSSVNILTAKNGAEALAVVHSTRPDLIFMDIEMPLMNGVDCCRAIKSQPESATIPVVMITAKGDDASRMNCQSAGCNDFLTKPLDRNLFLHTASRFVTGIDRRQKRSSLNTPGVLHSRGRTCLCTVSDLSVGGAFITADFDAESERLIHLSFTLPDGAPIACQGKITWLKRSAGGHPVGFGVNFVLLPKSERASINAFLQSAPPSFASTAVNALKGNEHE
jgi:CheY-like chemotaxis protein